MNQALRRGATVVTMPRFDLDAFLGHVERHRVTKAHLVPPIILALAKHPASTTTTSRACAGSTRAPRRWAPSSPTRAPSGSAASSSRATA